MAILSSCLYQPLVSTVSTLIRHASQDVLVGVESYQPLTSKSSGDHAVANASEYRGRSGVRQIATCFLLIACLWCRFIINTELLLHGFGPSLLLLECAKLLLIAIALSLRMGNSGICTVSINHLHCRPPPSSIHSLRVNKTPPPPPPPDRHSFVVCQ